MRSEFGRLLWGMAAILCAAVLAGCQWRDEYTARMHQTLSGSSRLGSVFSDDQFGLSIRPPKSAQPVPAPEGFLGLLRGGEPPLEIAIAGSTRAESLEEFAERSIQRLSQAGLSPKADLEKLAEPVDYGKTFQVYSLQEERQLSGKQLLYFWYVYFTEAAPRKVMVAFVFPAEQFEAYSADMVASLNTLKLGEAAAAE